MYSFNATATMFSYFGYEFEVKTLLLKLNRATKAYFSAHYEILKTFLNPIQNAKTFGPRDEE